MKSFVNMDWKLRVLLKEVALHLPRSAMIYNVIKLKQSLMENPSEKLVIEIFAFSTEGYLALIRIQSLPQTIVVVFTVNTTPSSLFLRSLHDFIDWSIPLQFEGVENPIANFLIQSSEQPFKWELHDPIELHYMESETALRLKIQNSGDSSLWNHHISFGSLDSTDAIEIDSVWPAACPGSLEMLAISIELVGSGGVQISDKNHETGIVDTTLASWAIALPFGSIHALHTKPQYQGHGFAKMTMQSVSKNIVEKGRLPVVQIYKNNDASKHLNSKIGFIYSHDINLMHYSPQ